MDLSPVHDIVTICVLIMPLNPNQQTKMDLPQWIDEVQYFNSS